jgi:hypothetical protein
MQETGLLTYCFLTHSPDQPLTDVACMPGDTLTLVHSSFPGDVLTLTVPGVGEWFAAFFPTGAKIEDAAAIVRFMLVSTGKDAKKTLITNDYQEWVEDNNVVNLATVLPPEVKQHIRHTAAEARAEIYRGHLGARFPKLPPIEQEEKEL